MSEMLGRLHKLLSVKSLIENAIVAETALAWLQSYGPKGPVDPDSISVSVSQNLASACPGAKEAKKYLEVAFQQMFAEASQKAIALCEADIERARTALPPSPQGSAE